MQPASLATQRLACGSFAALLAFASLATAQTTVQEAYLKASNAETVDLFGGAIALDGDTLVVGTYLEDSAATGIDGDQSDDSARDAGAAYVFVRDGSGWTQQAYLKASNTETYDYFGVTVAISGDTIAVGAYGEDSSSKQINGDQSDNRSPSAGAVYVFVRNGTTWTQQAYIKSRAADRDDRFGYALDLSGDTLVVGTRDDSNATGVNGNPRNDSLLNAGGAFVYVRNGTTWSEEAYLKASNTERLDIYGLSVAVDGDTIAVGASGEDSAATGIDGDQSDNSAERAGAVYVYSRDAGSWSQAAYVKASNTDPRDSFFRVELSGDTLVVTASGEASAATGVNGDQSDNSTSFAGAAYVFVRSGTTWVQEAYVKAPNTETWDLFGTAADVDGDALVVGAWYEDGSSRGVNGDPTTNGAQLSGAAYTYFRAAGVWTYQDYLKASNAEEFDRFGSAVTLSGNTAVIAAPQEDGGSTGVGGNQSDNSAPGAGAAYVFQLEAPECYLVLGSGPGQALFTGAGHTWTTQLSGIWYSYPVLLDRIPSFPIPVPPVQASRAPAVPVARGTAQVVMWNRAVFPANPEQFSDALEVTLWSNGRVTARHRGTGDGMEIEMQLSLGPQGRRVLQFPFSINGL